LDDRAQNVQPNRGRLILFLFGVAVIHGLSINLTPMLFGSVYDTFGADEAQQGMLQSFFMFGMMLALLISGYVTEAIGARRSTIIALGLIALGSFLLGVANVYKLVLASAVALGMGSGWIVAIYGAVVTASFADIRQRMFMYTTAVFAASATVSPIVLGDLLDRYGEAWQPIFVAYSGLAVAWIVLLLYASRGIVSLDANQTLDPVPSDSTSKGNRGGAFLARLGRGIFNRGTFWILGGLVLLDTLAAGNILAWSARFFEIHYDIDKTKMGYTLAASSGGVFIGRLLLGTFISGRFSDRTVLGVCYGLGVLMYVLILLKPGYPTSVLLMGLSGAFIAAQAPTMYSIASARFGSRAATAIPLIDAIGVGGSFVGPAAVGALAMKTSLHTVLWVIPALGGLLVIVVFLWQLLDRDPDLPTFETGPSRDLDGIGDKP